nr:DUF3006 family protein [Aquibacillus halophilus]
MDRIEEGKFAVILVDEINKEFILPKAELPVGSSEQSYFDLTIENDKITSLKLNEQTTSTEQEKVDNLISKIRSKNKDSKFKKK